MTYPRTLGLVLGTLLAALVAAMAVVLITAPGQVRAAIPAANGPCVAGWREMPIPDSAFVSSPFEIITRDGKQAWIVGGTNDGVLALKWNGSKWKRRAGATSGHRGLTGASQRCVPVYHPTGTLCPLAQRYVTGQFGSD